MRRDVDRDARLMASEPLYGGDACGAAGAALEGAGAADPRRASGSTGRSSTTRTAPSGCSSRSAGRGYFILRSLSGLANSMGAMFVVHTLLLTATGYSLTLLMASLYRRLITMRAMLDGADQPGDGDARRRPPSRSSRRGAIATFLKPDSKPVGVEYLGAILLDFSLLAAWSALYYGINYYLLLEEEIDQRARLESQALDRAAGDAALPAQPAFPVQHAEHHLDAGAAEADRARQCDAGAAVVLPALHAGQRADRQGDAGAGGRDAEALPRDREDALRGPAAAAFQDRRPRRSARGCRRCCSSR